MRYSGTAAFSPNKTRRSASFMRNIIYLIGLIVVVIIILSLLGVV